MSVGILRTRLREIVEDTYSENEAGILAICQVRTLD